MYMIDENTFLPFKISQLDDFVNKNILVLIPHQDDETFACGGTLVKISQLVSKIDFCLITDGAMSSKDVTSDMRNKELEKVATFLSVKNIFNLNIPDRKVYYNMAKISQEIESVIKNYDVVFSPNIFDIHPDHRYLAQIMVKLIKKDVSCEVFFYEVTLPQPLINFLVDISDVVDKKMQMIKIYQSQLNLMDYDEKILLLNKARTLAMENIQYAEGFYRIKNKNELMSYLDTLLNIVNGQI